jgi:nitrogen fixation/metabolism regulation signal transduction histidine kinase
VRELAAAAQRVASGDLGGVAVRGPGEIGDLARAFAEMTEQLRDSRERIVQAERVAAWREMARRLAHELKNPLFPIQLSIETLRRVADERPDSPDLTRLVRESGQTILEELRSLQAVIEEFSAFARLPQPRLAPTDVNAVVEQVLALYQPSAREVRLERQLAPGLPAVPADRDLLARALGNLLANALDAAPPGGTVRVRTVEAGGAVAVEVADTGPGLTDEQRARLFTPYFTTKKGGTGLGLAIVQGIASDHGGRVDVRGAPGSGAAFTLLLPLRRGAAGAPSAGRAQV